MTRRPQPLVLHLPARQLPRARSVAFFLRHQLERRVTPRLVSAFRFKSDERWFALQLLAAKPNLWLFRTNQLASCGDFLAVDMSSPDPRLRVTWALDLKLGAPLRRGGGGAGDQLLNVPAALSDLARRFGVLGRGAPLRLLTGDASALLAEVSLPARQAAG